MNARELIRNAIAALVRESGVTGPLAEVTAAVHLEWAAQEAVRTRARTAREDGASWAQIAGALGSEPDPDRGITPAAAAFGRVASDLGRGQVFAWTCPECRETVIDRGPELAHPEDQEQGHADGCARLAEAVRGWRAQLEGGGDD